MDSCTLQANYDFLVDQFNDADEMALEDVHLKMHQNWRFFLAAGFNATQVAKMMSDEDVSSHMRALLDSGADLKVLEEKARNIL